MTCSITPSRVGPRGTPSLIPSTWAQRARGYADYLLCTNGATYASGLLRVFGVGQEALDQRDGLLWNAEDWRDLYGVGPEILIWGENVFGDQFCLDLPTGRYFLLNCEGGEREDLPPSLQESLEELVHRYEQNGDASLFGAAVGKALVPAATEHLSFTLPLICGGSATVDNLEVFDASAHLTILGQILAQSRGLEEGTPIAGFVSSEDE